MKDTFSREISYLRISVTDLCNLRCTYCMPEEGVCKLSHEQILSFEEIIRIVKAFKELGVNKVRLTGGEPLVRKGIVSLCEEIKKCGIEDLSITTNGILLPKMAVDLNLAGVDRVNISLDTLDPIKYEKITRGGNLKDALFGINTALAARFKKVKLNTVLIGGFNDDEITALAEKTKDEEIDLRFIELMPMPGINIEEDAYVSSDLVLEKLHGLKPIGYEGVARMYELDGYKGRIGLISPLSCNFCSMCNRIRLTADGYIKPCLHSKAEVSVKGLYGDELKEKLKEVILLKPKEHPLLDAKNYSAAQRNMNKIGG